MKANEIEQQWASDQLSPPNSRKNKSFYTSQTILLEELERIFQERREEREDYSITTFAKELGLNRTVLSLFLNKKRTFKKRVVLERIKDHISPPVLQRYLKEVEFENLKRPHRPEKSVDIFSVDENGKQYLTEDQRKFSEDPYCFALLVAFDLEDFEPTLSWFQQKFGLSQTSVKSRLDRMAKLGLLDEVDGFYRSTGKRPKLISRKLNYCTTEHTGKLSAIHQEQYKKNVYDGVSEPKAFSEFWYFAIDPKDLEQLKGEGRLFVKKFQRRQISSAPKQVYSLNVRLVPLSN